MSFYCEGRSSTVVPVQIQDLEDIALDWAVAFSTGMTNSFDFTAHFPRVRMVQWDEGGPSYLSAGWGPTHKGPPFDWEPQVNWEQLGALIDKYGMCWTYTARDHENQRISAFCPGSAHKGRAYGKDCKSAMLRALVNHLQESEEIEIPIDVLKVSKTFVHPDVKAQFPEFPVPEVIVYEDRMYDGDF